MDIYTAVSTRRTIRDFDSRPIEHSVIERIIDAGLKAPTNDHMRSWEFVIVNDKNIRENFVKIISDTIQSKQNDINDWLDTWESTDKMQRDMYLEALPKQSAMIYNAGCLIIPLFRYDGSLLEPKTLSSLNGFASIWCCIENMLLAAAAEGILGVTRIPKGNEAQHVKSLLRYPDNYTMPCYMALGYPAKDAVIVPQKEILPRERIHMNQW